MPSRTMATILSASSVGLLCLLLAACRPSAVRSVGPVLVYCTPDAVPFARIIQQGEQRQIVLAPMAPADILAALDGTRAGDFVVSVGGGLEQKLRAQELVRLSPAAQPLGVCIVSRTPLVLADLGVPGRRLGSGKSGDALDQAVSEGLPEVLRASIASNVCHRSARPDELVRLVRLGSLDAAFVWDRPPTPGLKSLPLVGEAAGASLRIVALACSRLPAAEARAMLERWRGPATAQMLATGKPGTTSP